MSTHNWFALSVKSKYEITAASILKNKGCEVFLPLSHDRRKWSDRVKDVVSPLFPGYVFCQVDLESWTIPVLTTPGVLRIVGFGGKPAPVETSELEAVRRITDSGINAEPWPALTPGTPVRITGGALVGIEGVLVETKTGSRLVVSVSLLRRSVAVHLDREFVAPLQTPGLGGHSGQSIV